MHVDELLFLIPLLPLLGFAINGLVGSRFTTLQVGLVACAGPFASFVLSVLARLRARSRSISACSSTRSPPSC
jgi:NADH:ubiquinone oxidoreductase subunit 5 (subunit L)/multisubunit Na+/H+ antiporter MnhA subunit